MNVLVRNEYRVEVSISPAELKHYGITYEELDYKNIETRRVLWALTEEIRKLYGYNISLSGKMLIEVIKENRDSLKICFSTLSDKDKDCASIKQLVKNELSPVIAEFDSFEEMLEAISTLTSDTESSLYEKDGKYRLLFPSDEQKKKEIILLLCEFSRIYENSSLETARSREMWKLLASPFAVNRLTGTFLTD